MFDVSANVPDGTTKAQCPVMLQNLLIERFKLAVHRESKEVAKYALVVAKNGPKFKIAAGDTASEGSDDPVGPPPLDMQGFPVLGHGRTGTAATKSKFAAYWPKCTMEFLAKMLEVQLSKPVTDATDLKGEYEVSLHWIPDELAPASSRMPDDPALMSAIQEQLGLRLEAKKGPADFLVVDHLEKTPTDN